MKDYTEELKSPLWQKKRLEIMQRDKFTCQHCGRKDKSLHIHHLIYHKGLKPYEYQDEELITLCDRCHECETEKNSNLYKTFTLVRDNFKKHKLSMGLLENMLNEFNDFFEILDDTKNTYPQEYIENSVFVNFLIYSLYNTQSYSDAVSIQKYGIDLNDIVNGIYSDIKK